MTDPRHSAVREMARELIRDSIVEDALAQFLAQTLRVAADKAQQDRRDAEAFAAMMTDPNDVYVSMLAGTVAKPSWDQITYIYAAEFEAAMKAARIEGYEIARDDAKQCGWHLLRPEMVEELK